MRIDTAIIRAAPRIGANVERRGELLASFSGPTGGGNLGEGDTSGK
jgi:hypothetical protein